MGVIDVIIGILLIFLGVVLINFYLTLVKKKKHGGLSINFVSAGIGFIMVGIYIIVKGL